MSTVLVLPLAMLVCVGLLLAGLGVRRRPASQDLSTASSTPLWTRLQRLWAAQSPRWRATAVAAIVGGLVGYALTGWVVLLVGVPAAVLGLPWLLAAPPNRDLVLLQALDQWLRLLTGSILTGKSVGDAVRATRRQSPVVLQPAITLAVSRMDGRWSTAEALRAMADELDHPDVDAVVAALMLASQRGGTGTSETLAGLAESTQDKLRAMREVEAERAKPRIVVRQVTVITLVVLGVAMLVGRSYFEPYGTVVGQLVLAVLLACYVGALVILRQRTLPPRRERILAGGDWA